MMAEEKRIFPGLLRPDAMKLTVIGGCGAWPEPGRACSGYLIEHEGFELLVDPGYSSFSLMSKRIRPERIDAVLVSHGHPDHCADLSPLLRARAMGGKEPRVLPVYALGGAVDAVMGLDRAGMLDGAYGMRPIPEKGRLEIGPFAVEVQSLPHFVPSVGVRLRAGGRVLAYTGDSAPNSLVPRLGRRADVLLAEATFPEEVPKGLASGLCSARKAGEYGAEADVGELVLTHLWPGTGVGKAVRAARKSFDGRIEVATYGLTVSVE